MGDIIIVPTHLQSPPTPDYLGFQPDSPSIDSVNIYGMWAAGDTHSSELGNKENNNITNKITDLDCVQHLEEAQNRKKRKLDESVS